MKNIKLNALYFTFFLIIFLIGNCNVDAAEKKWPGVSASSIPGEYKNMDYCIYNTGTVYDYDLGYYSVSEYYSDTNFIFINDHVNKQIKFLGIDGMVHIATSEYDYVWDRSFSNQKIFFPNDLYEHLVGDNGKLNCGKLIFLETSGMKNTVAGTGSLRILTPNSLISEFFDGDYKTFENDIVKIKSFGFYGVHYGDSNISISCQDYTEQFNSIKSMYNYGVIDSISHLRGMSYTEFREGKLVDAMEYYTTYSRTIDQVMDELSKLSVDKIKNCSSDLISDYNKFVNTTIVNHQNEAAELKKKLDEQLTKVDPNGDDKLYAADREASDRADDVVAELKRDWNKYLNSIDFGEKIDAITCEGLLGPDLLDDISMVLTWIRISVPILVILLGSIDFTKVILSDDQQESKKATGRFVKRCIIAVAIFFIPTIIMYLLSFIDKIADVSCDIRLW